MPHHAVAHAQAARLAQQNAAQVFDEIALLTLDDQKSIRDQAAEDHSHLFAARTRCLREIPFELLEGKRLEIVELLENIGHGWGCVGVNAQFFALILLCAVRFFLGPERWWTRKRSQRQSYQYERDDSHSLHGIGFRPPAACLQRRAIAFIRPASRRRTSHFWGDGDAGHPIF